AACLEVLASMLDQDNQKSHYVRSFASVKLPELPDIPGMDDSDRNRAARKIQMYWAILHKAGFPASEARLKSLHVIGGPYVKHLNCHFNEKLRKAAYNAAGHQEPPKNPEALAELQAELEVMADLLNKDANN